MVVSRVGKAVKGNNVVSPNQQQRADTLPVSLVVRAEFVDEALYCVGVAAVHRSQAKGRQAIGHIGQHERALETCILRGTFRE